MNKEELIKKIYAAFNNRDIDTVLSTFHQDVKWPRAWEGDHAYGHDEIRAYWTRQWSEINPVVEPTGFKELPDGKLEVSVHQVAKDLKGTVLFDGMIKHIYTFKDDLIEKMDIEQSFYK